MFILYQFWYKNQLSLPAADRIDVHLLRFSEYIDGREARKQAIMIHQAENPCSKFVTDSHRIVCVSGRVRQFLVQMCIAGYW